MIKKITSALFLIAFLFSKTFATLSTPLITAPADASFGNAANALVNWYSVSGSTSYEIKFDTSSLLSNSLIQTITSSQYSTNELLFGTTYYWQVRAVKTTATIDSSDWTQIFSFTTIDTLKITAPINNATNQFPRTKLDWASSSGIDHYHLQLDELNTFNSTTLLDVSIADSTSYFFTTNLKFGTHYFWRVKAVHAIDSTEWSDANAFTIIDTVSLTSPTNGASFLSTNVGLNWYNIQGIDSSYVELDTDPLFNSANYRSAFVLHPNSDWIPHNLHFGTTYYWHVRSYLNGDSTQWSQTWSFSTLDAVTLNSPVNGAVEQPVKILLNWNTASNPITYDLDLDTSASFNSSLHFYSSDTISQHQVSQLYFGTPYFWRVRIRNLVDTSHWSSVYSFTTLDTLNALFPANGATNQAANILLNWPAVSGVAKYYSELDTTLSFNSPQFKKGSNVMSEYLTSNLLSGTKYFWRIRASNSVDTSMWNTPHYFTTSNVVTLTAPANAAADQTPKTYLNWANYSGAISYIIEYDISNSFSSPLLHSDSSVSSNFYATNLYFNKTYYWHVKAITAVDTSSWSSVWNFKTLDQLVHTSPADGSVNDSLNTILNWSSAYGSSSYIYRYDTNPDFLNAIVVSVYNSRDTLALTQYGTTYYWQVSAVDSVDTSAWSNTWSFSTLYESTPAPFLKSPANFITNLASPLTLAWLPLAGSTAYHYEYSTSSSFINAVSGTTIDTSVITSSLNSYTTYYWRVQGQYAGGYTPWSQIWSFTTLNPFTSGPLLIAPTNAAVNVASPVLFVWHKTKYATTYQCQYGVDSLFAGPNTLLALDTIVTSLPLVGFTHYYWRVRGVDDLAYSPWSDVWSFTTESPLLFAPTQLLPANGDTTVIAPAVFHWSSAGIGFTYECEYDTDSLFTNAFSLVSSSDTVSSTTLQDNTTYYWRVRSTDGATTSPWSYTWHFKAHYPVGIKSIYSSDEIILFPNPATDKVELKFKNPANEIISLQIFSSQGNKIFETTIKGEVNKLLDVSALAKGIYFTRMQSASAIFVKKLVVR